MSDRSPLPWANLRPYSIRIEDEVLSDLRQRLRTRHRPQDLANDDWGYGVNGAYLDSLLDYWQDGYDWRFHEAAINCYGNYLVHIGGLPIHFMHVRGTGPNPTPLVLTHGWPWTFWDFRKLIGPLTDPAAHGGDPADCFDVVIPSLPGFGFSTPSPRAGFTIYEVADVWATLMTEVLRYDKFGAHGGDYGTLVTAQLGHKYPELITGLHFAPRPLPLNVWNVDRPWADLFAGSLPGGTGERAAQVEYERRKVGHMVAHVLHPQTLAYAMHDSPAGLAAWLLERRHSWSDNNGDVRSAFSWEDLLTNFTIYWATNSFVSSARLYADNQRVGWRPVHEGSPVVNAPTAVTVFEKDLPPNVSLDWMKDYFDLRSVTRSPTGGHFAAAEEPERVVGDIRAFFRGLR
jgi:pimeloyl-ACP methyl ester carboxylesterase